MTGLIYQTNSFLREFTARVVAVDTQNRSVALEKTVFYPGGGGQPCDIGQFTQGMKEFPVIRVKKEAGVVWHFLGESSDLPEENNLIEGAIDWDRRYALMKTHTALHILCGVVYRDFGALVTGGDMDPLKGRMDFEFESLTKDLVGSIEKAVNIEVEKARPIRVAILPREEAMKIPDLIRTKINLLPPGIAEIRTVELVGLDLQADGGTHVNNTAEVGYIRVVDYKSKGKINKRIYIELS